MCAGCSSNVPYCSSPRSSSALMLLCQLLKSDKLSIFSIASQNASNSLATKLLISMVSFPCFSVLSQCIKRADTPPRLHSISLVCSHDPFSNQHFTTRHTKTLCQGNRLLYLWLPLYRASLTLYHVHCHERLQAEPSAPSNINVSVTLITNTGALFRKPSLNVGCNNVI